MKCIPGPEKPILKQIEDITDMPGRINIEWAAGDGIIDGFKVHKLIY